MASKKKPNNPGRSKPTRASGVMPVDKSQVVEATYTDGAGRTHSIDPGRLTADLALQRLKVVEKYAVMELDGEYQAQLKYRAK